MASDSAVLWGLVPGSVGFDRPGARDFWEGVRSRVRVVGSWFWSILKYGEPGTRNMAKYSTGSGGGSDDGGACELCGASTESLQEANVAGAALLVCRDCAPHDDAARTSSRKSSGSSSSSQDAHGGGGVDRKKRAVQNTAKANDIWDGDSSHWEEGGTDYDDDPLPYLVSGYGEALVEARQDAGLQREELADDLDVEETDLLALEQGRATQAGVGGSVVEAVAERLDVTLVED